MARFLGFLSFFLLAVGACRAALPADLYWNSVLPNTPMPSAISDAIRPDVMANMKTAATDAQVQEDPAAALFFIEKDLRPGARMTLHFTRTTSAATFLPRKAADSIPFSSAKLPAVLARLSIDPNSNKAQAMKKTLHECEEPAIDGETKLCATSLESMVEFSTSSLRTREVRALSTTVEKESTPKQEYTVASVQKVAGPTLVACHAENYEYAVFLCHTTDARAYTVSMVGRDGTKGEAVAACHADAAALSPKAFEVLKVKPGTVPVCHFLPQNDLVWGPNK
ncbi:BURP domain-containing protein 6-like [Elaeis guineensis]|uniref:BURP domain-containing protein 6-like n=1 Tax=Elaeis guineensis var. tenera TaxID=51953 RepID=UPI003C6D7151